MGASTASGLSFYNWAPEYTSSFGTTLSTAFTANGLPVCLLNGTNAPQLVIDNPSDSTGLLAWGLQNNGSATLYIGGGFIGYSQSLPTNYINYNQYNEQSARKVGVWTQNNGGGSSISQSGTITGTSGTTSLTGSSTTFQGNGEPGSMIEF